MVLGYLFKNRVLLVLVVIVAGVIFISQKINSQNTDQLEIQNYQVIAPGPDLASKVGTTASRVYYIRSFDETDSTITLLTWYDYDEKQWQKHTTPLPFDKSQIKIHDRGYSK